MSVAYQSHTAASIGSGVSSRVVTKPSGLAIGDLMVAYIAVLDSAATPDVISGWTDSGAGLQSIAASGVTMRARVIYKIADSGDTAASDFTFTVTSGPADFMGASIHRVNGQNPLTPIDKFYGNALEDDNTITTGDGNYNANLTPTYASELYLFFVSWAGGTDVISQAIATSNPTWTEDYDTVSTLGMNALHATRPETTATGGMAFTINGGSGLTDTTAFLIIIKDLVNVTVSPTTINATAALVAPTISGGGTVSPSVVNATGAVNTPTVGQADWSPQGKSSAPTWTPQSKS